MRCRAAARAAQHIAAPAAAAAALQAVRPQQHTPETNLNRSKKHHQTQNEPDQLAAAYEALLAEWPLCYGYWKKYADALSRHGREEEALAALERCAAAAPYSVPFWEHYAGHVVAKGAAPDAIRRCIGRLALLRVCVHSCACACTAALNAAPLLTSCLFAHAHFIPQRV